MRFRNALLSSALLLLASVALAAPPRVPGVRTVAVGEVFEVEFEEDAAGPVVLENTYPLEDVFIREAKPSRAKTVAYIIQPKKPGNYRFVLWTKGDTVGEKRPFVYYDFTATGTVPAPDPKPKPPDPKPDPGTPDAVLVAKFKDALAKDIAAGSGTKAKAADLAVVFDSGASLLDLNDPAIAPRTVGELYTKMVLASVAKGVPRPPYLANVRAVVDAHTPLLNGNTELTPAIKADFQRAYRAVATALTEASK